MVTNHYSLTMKSQFVSIILLSLAGLSLPLPLEKEKEFFWYSTDEGKIVPAFLYGEPNEILAVEDNIQFWHYTTGDPEGRLVEIGCDNCTSHFVPEAPLVITAHGWGSSHLGGLGASIRSSFEKRGEQMNFILINYSKLVPHPFYGYSVKNVKPVGEYTAKFVNFLIEKGLVSVDNINFVGHSLGAHVANYISANMNGNKLHRVFALDPAMPLFNFMADSERIDPDDGNFVSVIHTAIDFLGMSSARGHIDFYPNSGKRQPGCETDLGEIVGTCSHGRGVNYLAESIHQPKAFLSCPCESWQEFVEESCNCEEHVFMGWDTPSNASGKYYLHTNGNPPYGLGK